MISILEQLSHELLEAEGKLFNWKKFYHTFYKTICVINSRDGYQISFNDYNFNTWTLSPKTSIADYLLTMEYSNFSWQLKYWP